MAHVERNSNSVIRRLVPFAVQGKTTGSIPVYKSDSEECRKLASEGFTIVHAVRATRKGEYSLKVKWNKPTTSTGAAAELLKIAKTANQQPALTANA